MGELNDLSEDLTEHHNLFGNRGDSGDRDLVAHLTVKCLDQTILSICPPPHRVGRL